MPTSSKDPNYLFDLIPVTGARKATLPDLGACTIEEAFIALSKVSSWAEVESGLDTSVIRKGGHDILRAIFLAGLKELKHYQVENCTSMSNYCETRACGSLAVSTTTLSDDLKCASLLHSLAFAPYNEDIATYLTQSGRGQGQGGETESAFARLPCFKVADFFGHKSKLHLLDKLLKAGHKKIDWARFFESKVEKYEAFVTEQLFPEKDPFAKSPASSRMAAENWPGSEQAFAEITQRETSEAPEATQDEETLLDPFSPRESATYPSIAVRFQGALKLSPRYIGTLAGSPIYKDTRLATDDGYLDRARKLLGEGG